MSPVDSKRCPKCQTTKAAEHFGACKTKPDGLQSWCKECHRVNYKRLRADRVEPDLSGTKTCFTCEEEKPRTEFYGAMTFDGLAGSCKSCTGSKQRTKYKHRPKNPDCPPGHKKCTACFEVKTAEEFSKHPRGADGRLTQCKACVKAKNAARAAALPQKRRAAGLKQNYGITYDQYERWLELRGHSCEICGYEMPKDARGAAARLHVDHDHSTGALRGLLCSKCNAGLGHFKDDPGLLYVAAEYLEEHALHAEYFQYPWESSTNPTVDLLGPAAERRPSPDLLTDEEMLDLI